MRTIAVAVAILCACFMQEVSGDLLSATPVIQETDSKPQLTEKTEAKSAEEVASEAKEAVAAKTLNELQEVAMKLDAKAQELYKVADLANATDEAKNAADQAGQDYDDAVNKFEDTMLAAQASSENEETKASLLEEDNEAVDIADEEDQEAEATEADEEEEDSDEE